MSVHSLFISLHVFPSLWEQIAFLPWDASIPYFWGFPPSVNLLKSWSKLISISLLNHIRKTACVRKGKKCPLHSEANHVHVWIRIFNESDNVRDSWKFKDRLAAPRSTALRGQGIEFSPGFPSTWRTEREARSHKEFGDSAQERPVPDQSP
jgi:hypothetical protein